MSPRDSQGPEHVYEPKQYQAGGRLRPRPWPVGQSESYGKVEFDDSEGKAVLTVYVQRALKKAMYCMLNTWLRRYGWMGRSFA